MGGGVGAGFAGAGTLVTVAGVTVSRLKKWNVVGRTISGDG